jgi:hypothetical protein
MKIKKNAFQLWSETSFAIQIQLFETENPNIQKSTPPTVEPEPQRSAYTSIFVEKGAK